MKNLEMSKKVVLTVPLLAPLIPKPPSGRNLRLFLPLFILLLSWMTSSAWGAKSLYQIKQEAKEIYAAENDVLSFPDSIVNRFTNRWIDIFARVVPCIDSQISVVLTVGTREFALPSNFLREYTVRDQNFALKKIDQRDIGEVRAEVKGAYYIRRGATKTLGIDKPATATGDTVWVSYAKKAKVLTTDTMVHNLDEYYENALPYFVAYEMAKRDANPIAISILEDGNRVLTLLLTALGQPPIDIMVKVKEITNID